MLLFARKRSGQVASLHPTQTELPKMNNNPSNSDHEPSSSDQTPGETNSPLAGPLPSAHDTNPDGSPFDGPVGTNPYAAVQPQYAPSEARPSGVSAVAILMCVFGGIGMLTGLMAVVQWMFAGVFQDMMKNVGGPNAQGQAKYMDEMAEVTDGIFIPSILLTVATLILCSCMIFGGVLLLRRNIAGLEFSRKTLFWVVGLVFFNTALAVYTQVQMAPVMRRMMESNAGNGAPNLGGFQFVFMIITIVIAVVWGIAKVVMCLWGASYLRRDHVIDYFNRESPAEPS